MTRRPKCLYVMPDFCGGGPEQVSEELFKRLPDLGVNIDLAIFRDLCYKEKGAIAGVNVIPILGSDEKISHHARKFVSGFLKVAKEYDTLLGLAEADPWPVHLVTVAGILLRKRVVWAVHTCLSHHCAMKNIPKHRLKLTKVLARFTDKIIAISQGVKDDLVECVGIPQEKIEVIYNPIDVEGIGSLSREQVEPNDLHLFVKPVILFVGHVTRLKGCDLLILAAQKLQDNGLDFNVVFLGEGEDRDALMHLADECGVRNRVSMLGYRTNPYRYMASSQAFVLPSRLEGLPTVLIEAMASGCPVVATNCPTGPAEILSDGRYGHLVEMEDVNGIASALEELISNPERHEHFMRVGLERASSFEASRSSKRYSEVLNSI